MAHNMEDDSEIVSLNAHLSGEPAQAIVLTPGQTGIERRPAGSIEEDYRLRALPFALKGEADTWFMRLPSNSIRSWAEFRSVFLDYFFPATRTT
ncbi:GATA zinc finger domain-containing protein 14-like [Salvia divinorum]|uniref:GATA zinc finger domain-containing protein 14-like n=1 Tax=Salvia divinorum TaxID=28513 RepID=A0ABD1GYA3_SALDI